MRFTKAVLAVSLVAGLGSGCVNGLFFHPDPVVYQTPAARGLPFEEVVFRGEDGTRLTGWFVPARGTATGTVVHVHGNAQNMTAHFSFSAWLPAEGFNLFVFDGRGYGESEGRAERRGLVADTRAALRTVANRPDVDPGRIVVLGQSLGGALAIAALGGGDNLPPVRALAVDSAFSSYRGIVREKIAALPVLNLLRWPLAALIVGNHCSPDAALEHLPPMPIVFLHGTADRVVSSVHSVRLYKRARTPKALWVIPGGAHTEALMRDDPRYRRQLVAFFQAALETPLADP